MNVFTPDIEDLTLRLEGVCCDDFILFGGSAKLAAPWPLGFLLLRADVGASDFGVVLSVFAVAALFGSSFVSSLSTVLVDFLEPGIAGILGILISLALLRNCIS